MKYKLLLILAVLFVTLAFWGCKGSGGGGSSLKEENFDKDASYAIGMNIGSSLAADGIFPNLDEFFQGIKDSISGGETRFDENEAIEIIRAAFNTLTEKQEAEAMQMETEAMQKGIEFLAENSKKPGVIITPSGLQYEVITETNGAKPAASDVVRVHYEGRLIDGEVFDSSYEWGNPVEFPLNGVISGWTEGLQLMGVGSKYKFYIPSELAYGSRGAGSAIPPFAPLIFEVELLEIVK